MVSNHSTGMCVPYSIRETPDKGRGIFADAKIHKGSTVWRHVAGQYTVHDERSLKELLAKSSHSEAVYELTHVFCVAEFPGYMIRVFDDGELMNHSAQPTVVRNATYKDLEAPSIASAQDVLDALMDSHFSLIAARDLEVGDELVLDYNTDPQDPIYYEILCKQYGVSWEWL